MTGSARRSVPLLLAGAVALAFALTACASAAPRARTSPQPALAGTVAVIPGAARQVTLSMNYGANADGGVGAHESLVTRAQRGHRGDRNPFADEAVIRRPVII